MSSPQKRFYHYLAISLGMLKERKANIYNGRRMIWNMAVSLLKAKYSGLKLGIWIAILNPLLVLLAISFVFTHIIKLNIDNFPFFALAGIFPWLFFSGALAEAASSILSQQGVLRQFKLSREILPLVTVLSEFLSFLIGWCVIYPIFLVFNPKIIVLFPLLLLVLVLMLCFLCGLGITLAVLNVLSRDIGQMLGIILMFWFWVTPVFYSIDMVPLRFRWICNINPMTHFTVYYRDVLFRGVVPDGSVFVAVLFWAIISMVTGIIVFSWLEPKLLKKV